MKIVLDTNVLVSGIFWKAERFELIITPDILDDYISVISKLAKKKLLKRQFTKDDRRKVIICKS